MEKVLWLFEDVKSGLQSFVLEISCWTMLHGWVDQLKLIAIKLKHWEQSTSYHVGDSWHAQNTKSIKLLVKMKNVSFILGEKTKWTFWASQ